MTFVSYAQNFEDVMLWRALSGIERGFYIDVGTADPDTDTVTRAFYDRGWSGINIEPVAVSMRRIAATRLRDINLQVAVGRTPGSATFYVVEGTGLSTLVEEGLSRLDRAGYAAEQTTVEVTTLADICAEHVPEAVGAIHFLKIDVEGAEADVLAGADFKRFRPWIVLIEATAPMSSEQTHAAWEPGLLAAGYRFVYFDGLNRFYVALEHLDALEPCFAAPPNVFDDFIRVADVEGARRMATAEIRAGEAAALVARAEARTREVAAAMGEAVMRARAQARAAHAAERAQAAELAHLRHRLDIAEAWNGAMRGSTSWRVTAPLRRAVALARRRSEQGDPIMPESPLAPEADSRGGVSSRAVIHPGLRRTVHQFHSGSAVGDAITNAMLLTRRLLRGQGYESDIFVEHVDPLLAGDLKPLDALPASSDYVLILRHSMGYDAFPEVLALPAPKVLIYHNITPPELLDGAELKRYAELGRRQLAELLPTVAATLADSEYNTLELRRLGAEGARACTLLFDIDELRAKAARKSALRRLDAFTVLFVGRVGASKGQADLLAAFALFHRAYSGPSRLVMVGRHGGPDDPYFETLTSSIQANGLEAHVTLTGLVSDAELHEWYSAADLYLSLSRHEGFGVPLVEAMAYGIPVLARPSGAIPYTLAGAAELIGDTDPKAVAARMLELARDPKRCEFLAVRQSASLDRLALDRQMRPLLSALAAAGAMPPEEPGIRERLRANMRFTVAGHVNGSYSLASINRNLAEALEWARPGGVRLIAVEGQPTDDLSGVPAGARTAIGRLAARGKPDTGPELVISQHYPVYLPTDRGDVCAALFFWEETVVPSDTIGALSRDFDGVLAASAFVAKALIDSGLSVPVRVIGYTPDLSAFERLRDEREAALPGAVFTFLHVSSGFPRKGIDVLIAAFAAAFRSTDPVRLVIKVFPNPHNSVAEQLARLRAERADLGEIVLVDRDLPDAEMLDLYRHADAIVLPTRGEGFNIPAAEAMAAGIPLIVTGFGGHMDFCDAGNARLLDYSFARAESHLSAAHSHWVEPDQDDLVAALRAEVVDRSASAARARRARAAVTALTDRAALLRRVTAAGADLLLAAKSGRTRVAWVSTWQVRCGVAEYSGHLVAAMAAAHPSLDVTVLCDHRTIDTQGDGAVAIQPTWELGHAGWSVPQIAAAIAAANPRVVVVQHQPGLIAWKSLAELLGLPAMAPRIVVVALHNTRHLLDIGSAERARAVIALHAAARVLVHTLADLDLLKGLGLVGNVMLLPHGAMLPVAAPLPRRLTVTDTPVIGCYGFFLPGKGIGALIEAMAMLRRRWPNARLRLVNAAYGTPESADEIATCRTLAASLGVPIEWHTDFLPHPRSLDLLGECDVVALPYQASQEASSAALRGALGAGTAVAVTPLPLFDEAEDAVFRFAGLTADQLAVGLAGLLDNVRRREDLRRTASSWLADRNWNDLGSRLGGLLRGLAA